MPLTSVEYAKRFAFKVGEGYLDSKNRRVGGFRANVSGNSVQFTFCYVRTHVTFFNKKDSDYVSYEIDFNGEKKEFTRRIAQEGLDALLPEIIIQAKSLLNRATPF